MWIVVEGVDGAGKSTLITGLQEQLLFDAYVREPGGTPFAEWVGGVVRGYSVPWSPPTTEHARAMQALLAVDDPWLRELPQLPAELQIEQELRLFLLARADIYAHVTEHHAAVLQDRGMLSTYAYQAQDQDTAVWLDHWAPQIWPRQPDITLLLDLDPRISLARVAARSGVDRIEARGITYFERVRERYLQEAERQSTVVIIDANQSPAAVLHDALAAVRTERP
jgi:dTMP kinase